MVTEYVAHSLLSQYGADAKIKRALDSFDFYIFPVVNPDGI
jgi:murein tripeptide amidase MpaA